MASQPDSPSPSNSTEINSAQLPFATPALDFPVVGIGASAGGLEAFSELFSHLSTDTGMAFVLVQHLDPTQPSLLSDILSRTTSMPVQEAQEGTAVAPNQVYVIPPNRNLTIEQGRLRLTPRDSGSRLNFAVNIFLKSLAADQGNRAIAVILSGGDSDGSHGIEAIKAAGGITFAQCEDTAQIASMPSSAMATGQVDFVLPPAEIAVELGKISGHPYVAGRAAVAAVPPPGQTGEINLLSVLNIIQSAFGVDFSTYKHATLQRRILRRMALYQLEHLEPYVRYLQAHPKEVKALYEEILIHVTSFFRDREVFDTLKQEIFPQLLRDRPADSPLRIWVAGCSTGEEAYSLAIGLIEFLAELPQAQTQQIQIFATDLSEPAIEKARLGIYRPSEVMDVSPERLERFFVPTEGGYQVNKAVRELCIFARQNLCSDPPFSRLDLISCRNVLIYFGLALQKKMFPLFYYGLKPDGFLLLGSAESVGGFINLFRVVSSKHKIYAKQASAQLTPMELGSAAALTQATLDVAVTPPRPAAPSLSEVVDRLVLNDYAPVGVVVNNMLEIVQFRGKMEPYLSPSPGQASLSLLKMVREDLRLDLRTLLHEAQQSKKPINKTTSAINVSGLLRQVHLDIVPIQPEAASKVGSDPYFLILFTPWQPLPELATAADSEPAQPLSPEQALIRHLEQELEDNQAYLRAIIEEQDATNQNLRAANEETLSSNEELQSTNEELQTAKEEIQATNEELSTINAELHRRNLEAIQVGNDLENLLSSIKIPILMVNTDLTIRRFTPAAADLFNLLAADLGRSLRNINHNLTLADLDTQIAEVISTLTLKTQEVQDQRGCWYDLRIYPYHASGNRVTGAVLVLVQIDTFKRSAESEQNYAEAIAQTVGESLVVLDDNLRVVTANQRFYSTFQVSPAETESVRFFELGNGQWNIAELRSQIEDVLPHNTQIIDLRVNHRFERIGRKVMSLNLRKITLADGRELILIAINDLTPRPDPPPADPA
ncbi:MAG: PAS domain-containing protein [Leptolyngbya sp. DLM2.Bin27]|nr:MAG: PAS domain-containing protein [Leptolyngbya sp. DLM2.Bin27]